MTAAAAASTEWFSLAELAALKLPAFPSSRQAMTDRATAEGWATRRAADGTPLARLRAGRGGGCEYHMSVLPMVTRIALVQRVEVAGATAAAELGEGDAWARFEQLGDKAKARAAEALAIVQQVEALVAAGLGKTAAVVEIGAGSGAKPSTIHGWFAAIKGVPVGDRLPHLAPGYTGGGKAAEIDDLLWQVLRSDYLRASRPSWESCIRRTEKVAKAQGKTLPGSRTLWRRFEATVDPRIVTFHREGIDALRRHLPPQQRTVADLHAMELVNIDGHTCDVRVRFPDGSIGRPVMIAIQDVFSRKFLAWRYAPSEDAVTARMCFADLFRRYGIPKGLLSDNGRAFACKWLTGGMPTRFRFKVKADEPIGLMKMLDIGVHWALPFRGSSKPIERGFRDLCDDIARIDAFEGAYTGNNALNKPHNYGEKVMEWADFVRLWDAGMAEHNARPGRTTEMARAGDSFDQVFARSYAASPIRKATDSHLRLALMTGEQVRAATDTGAVKVLGNAYWSPELVRIAGTKVTVRFDPEDATQPVHVYADAKLIAVADLWEKTGFLDAEAAKRRARLESDHRKATRAATAALDLLSADQLRAQFAATMRPYEDEALPEPTVIHPVRVRGNTAVALQPGAQFEHGPAPQTFTDRVLAGGARLRVVDE